MKRTIAASLVVGAVLLALVAGTVFALRALERGTLRERARILLESGLGEAFAQIGIAARVQIGALEGPLLPTLVMRDVRVEAAGATPLRVDRLRVRLDLRALLVRRAVLEEVHAEGLVLSLSHEEPGGFSWERARAPRPPPGEPAFWDELVPTVLELRAFDAHDAKLELAFTEEGAPSRLEARADATLSGLVVPLDGRPPGWPAKATLEVAVSPGSVAGRRLDGATLALALQGSRLRLERASLESGFGRARISGATDLAPWLGQGAGGALDLAIDARELDLGVLLARPELAGSLQVHGTLQALRASGAPVAQGRLSADLTLDASRLGRLRLDSGRLRARYDAGAFDVAEAALEGSFGRVSARGDGERERIRALTLDADLVDLAALDALAPLLGRKPFGLQGGARLAAELAGPVARPHGRVDLDTRSLVAAGLELGTIRLRAESDDGVLVRVSPFAVRGKTLTVEAIAPLLLRREGEGVRVEAASLRGPKGAVATLVGQIDPDGVRDLRVELPELALAPFSPLVGQGHSLGGILELHLAANGPLPRPAVSGRLAWRNPRFDRFHADMLEATLRTDAGMLRGDARLLGLGRELLSGTLALPWRPGLDPQEALRREGASLSLVGDAFDLALLDPFVAPDVTHLEGRADLSLELRGGAPVRGALAVRGAKLDVAALGQRLGPLDGRIAVEGAALRVEEVKLVDAEGGSATLSGVVTLDGVRPERAELRLDLDRYLVRYRTELRFLAQGRIDVEGPIEALAATGGVTLQELRLYLRASGDPLLREITVIEPGETPRLARGELPLRPGAPTGPLADSTVDVSIKVPHDSWVVGEGANVEIAGDLQAKKDAGALLGLSGTLSTVQGSYRAQGRLFTIEPSKVSFDGRAEVDPLLDVKASGRAGGVRIFVAVTGRASHPAVHLTSEPPYPERDILALLLFGRTRDQLGRSESGALQSFVAQTTGGAALEQLNAFLGPTLRIDTLEAVSSEKGQGGTLAVGRWVSDQVFVQYGQGYGETEGNEVRVQWRLTPRWSLESRYSTEEGSSADVLWNLDY
ncbi:MAG TPA: translocation/assembly module TamB domain-containing protein [Myxococcota bacterium]|nr:translocation/assembly module TamB domain-containing protein [Myxococcota bacterium]